MTVIKYHVKGPLCSISEAGHFKFQNNDPLHFHQSFCPLSPLASTRSYTLGLNVGAAAAAAGRDDEKRRLNLPC